MTALIVASFFVGNGAAIGTDSEKLTPDEAAATVAEVYPKAVASSESGAVDATTASVEATADGFSATGTDVDTTIGSQASEAMTLQTESGELAITPLAVGPVATDGEVVNGDSVVYANTARETDTVVRPTDDGVETFTSIRGEASPEVFAWKVALEGDQRLVPTPDGGIAITDPTPETTGEYAAPKPSDVPGGTAASDALRAEMLATDDKPLDPDPARERAATEALDAVREVDDPNALAEAVAEQNPPEATATAGDAPSGETPSVPESAAPDDVKAALADQAEEVLGDARAATEQKLDDLQAQASAQDADAITAAEAGGEPPQVLATVEPVWAKDANGEAVEASLKIHGDVIEMAVEHRDAEVAYPVVADPWVQVNKTRLVWDAHPVYRTVTYIERWAIGLREVGSWHHSWCGWAGGCRHDGSGWYTVWFWGGQYASYLPNLGWGPLFAGYWYPVYGQYRVLDRWTYTPRWEAYVDYEWRTPCGGTAEFDDEPEEAEPGFGDELLTGDPDEELCGDGLEGASAEVSLPAEADDGAQASDHTNGVGNPSCRYRLDESIRKAYPVVGTGTRPYMTTTGVFPACVGTPKALATTSRRGRVCLQIRNGGRRSGWDTVKSSCRTKKTKTGIFTFRLTATRGCKTDKLRRWRGTYSLRVSRGKSTDFSRRVYPKAGFYFEC